MVRDGVVLGNMLMALLAFPRAFQDICYLFEYSRHYLLGNVITAPFNQSVYLNRAAVRLFDT